MKMDWEETRNSVWKKNKTKENVLKLYKEKTLIVIISIWLIIKVKSNSIVV